MAGGGVGVGGTVLLRKIRQDAARAIFIVNGPNTNAGHGGSAIHATEFQFRYIMQAIRHPLVTGTAALEIDRAMRSIATTLSSTRRCRIAFGPTKKE